MSSSPNIPYQAYKSKRHSRTPSNMFAPNVSPPISRPSSVISNGNSNGIVNGGLNGTVPIQPSERERELTGRRSMDSTSNKEVDPPMESRPSSAPPPNGNSVHASTRNGIPVEKVSAALSIPTPDHVTKEDEIVVRAPAPVRGYVQEAPSITSALGLGLNGKSEDVVEAVAEPSTASTSTSTPTSASASTSTSTSTALASDTTAATPTPIPRKSSSFRHVPLRGLATHSPLRSSPLRPAGTHSRATSTPSATSTSRQFEQPVTAAQTQTPRQPHSRITSLTSVHSTASTLEDRPLPTVPSSSTPHEPVQPERFSTAPEPLAPAPSSSDIFVPPPRTHSLNAHSKTLPKQPRPQSQSYASSPVSSPASSSAPTPAPISSSTPNPPLRTPAPYRPGFQPKGVYRPLTDEFASLRKVHRDVGRIERTKLERRLEKLIQLHFPPPSDGGGTGVGKRPGATAAAAGHNRRASSFFDLDFSDLRHIDPGELWRGVLQSQAGQGGKADIRAAEQRITPWQDDASVSKCPICTTSFHPLTNRKHHCRLCGIIICSLPVKRPQRPETCSLLFVVDPKTRKIEEVGEGVDYGVRKRRSLPPSSPSAGTEKGKEKEKEELLEEEKFLKGVRICRQCRHVLLRQQYLQEVAHVPTFVRLYEVFISLEKEIEDSLPQFQELILTLSHDDQPTKEASAARKRLLEAFAQYDALAKRIRKIPCPGGKGGSEDRVQLAILSRANLFLQKNMFPLQSLPKPKLSKSAKPASPDDGAVIDPDSAVAHALQPLLEQEALLESFVEEARAHRKFQDAKTLKTNLQEIRAEIDKIMANADGPMSQPKGRTNTGRK